MKLTNLCIVFVILELSIIFVLDSRINNMVAIVQKKLEYNKSLDSAVDDGTMDLVEIDSNRNIVLNKEKAVEQFFTSLYANFGASKDVASQKRLQESIPLILVTDMDGFYIYYKDTYRKENDVLLTGKWSEKYPFTYRENNLIYKFTFDDTITIYDRSKNEKITGNYKELRDIYPNSILADDDTFDRIRRNVIIGEIEKWMNYYINQYNMIASQFGITYQFWLPSIEKTDWYRTVDDISMFVLFQNYPYYAGSLETYNRYAFGGARITKSRMYYLKNNEDEGILYYHKHNCEYVNPNDGLVSYYTKEECAKNGAFPCPVCTP